jgi:heterodisulfide reductase subunit A
MDMRTYGKDFERYYDRAKEEHGVRFRQPRAHHQSRSARRQSLELSMPRGRPAKPEEFDMVVLSVGLETSPGGRGLAGRLGVELTRHNFVKTGSFSPVATSREGIYACGALPVPRTSPRR